MLRLELFFNMIALLLLCSSIRRLPPNRAYIVAVFEGSPIQYNIPSLVGKFFSRARW